MGRGGLLLTVRCQEIIGKGMPYFVQVYIEAVRPGSVSVCYVHATTAEACFCCLYDSIDNAHKLGEEARRAEENCELISISVSTLVKISVYLEHDSISLSNVIWLALY